MQYQIKFDLDFRRNPYPGKFVVIEGIDGSGKTTQVGEVAKKLSSLGGKVFTTKEPTREDEIGSLIHAVLQGKVKIPPAAIQYLYGADRVVHLEQVIEPRLKEKKTVISDRYFWSSVAYGLSDLDGASEKNRLLIVQSMLSFYHQFVIPDFTFYLRVSAQTAEARLSQMHKQRELYERKVKLEKIISGYEWLVEQFPEEITVIDGEKEVEEVTEKILNKVASIM